MSGVGNMINKGVPQLDELYKEIILEHYREPCGRTPLDRVDKHADGMNPLCGDEVHLSLKIENEKVEDVYLDGHGCSISVASGSILADMLKGKTLEEASELCELFKGIMNGKTDVEELKKDQEPRADLGDLEALVGVKQFPVRIKCALLPWTTYEEALKK